MNPDFICFDCAKKKTGESWVPKVQKCFVEICSNCKKKRGCFSKSEEKFTSK